MEWTEKQILDTLRFIEESDYDEVKLETGNLRLHVRKRGAPASALIEEASTAAAPQASVDTVDTHNRNEHEQAGETEVPAGMVAIRSPIVGTFYRAPAPHLPPFVAVGTKVRPGDTVCLIEVMKLFNTIKAGTSGTVVDIVVENGCVVKKNEVLILIEPQ
jgi:acetyl-CoA carboxylase biotin carboxyl carrier protein